MTIRVIVVDDSVVIRRAVATVLAHDARIEVVATAANGRLALRRIAELDPDVVTLDVELAGTNGLDVLQDIRRQWPRLPVIMYSSLTDKGAAVTLEALGLGAVDYAAKPRTTDRDELAAHVHASLLPLVRLWGTRTAPAPPSRQPSRAPSARSAQAAVGQPQHLPAAPSVEGPVDAVVIGVSTGGPDALARLIPMLPADLDVPVVIVQHMPPVFTAMLAKRLDTAGRMPVAEATNGERALPGRVYVAPGGQHTELRPGLTRGELVLVRTDAAPENSCRPAVDVLFRSAAIATRGRLLGVVLTGMGQDGLIGSQLIRKAGGTILAQDEASSVVWGMPGFVSRAGLAASTLPLDLIAGSIVRAVSRTRARAVTA